MIRILAVAMALLVIGAGAVGTAAPPDDDGSGRVTDDSGGNFEGLDRRSGPARDDVNPRDGSTVDDGETFTVQTESIDVHQLEGGRICAEKKEADVNKVTIYESTLHNSTVYHDRDDRSSGSDVRVEVGQADVDTLVMYTNAKNQKVNTLAMTGQCVPFDQNTSTTVEAYTLGSKTFGASRQKLFVGNGISNNPPEPGGLFLGDVLNDSSENPLAAPEDHPPNATDLNETVENVTETVGGASKDSTGQVAGTINRTIRQVDEATNRSTDPVTSRVDNTSDQATDAVEGEVNRTTEAVETATNDTSSTASKTVQNASQTTRDATDSVTTAVEGATDDGESQTTIDAAMPKELPIPTESGPTEPVVRYLSCTEVRVNGSWDRVQVRTHGYDPGGDRVSETFSVGDADGQSLTGSLAESLGQDDMTVIDLADTRLAGQDRVIDAVALGETSDGGFERVGENPDASACDTDVEHDTTPTSTDSGELLESDANDGTVNDDSSSVDSSSDEPSSTESDGGSSDDGGSLLSLAPVAVEAVRAAVG